MSFVLLSFIVMVYVEDAHCFQSLKGLPNQAAEPRHLHSASAGWGCWMLLRQDAAGCRRMPQVSVSVPLQELVKDHRFSLQTRDAGAVLSGHFCVSTMSR